MAGNILNEKANGKGTFILTSSNKRYYSESWKDNKTEITEIRENTKYKIIITLNKNNYKINEMKNCHCKSEYCFGDWETYSKIKTGLKIILVKINMLEKK